VYLDKLGNATGYWIDSLDELLRAIGDRLQHFKASGCKFSDIGVQGFPSRVADKESAAKTLDDIIHGKTVAAEALDEYLGFLFQHLASLYAENDIVMQLHIAVRRNVNSDMYSKVGADTGFDCIGDSLQINSIVRMFDELNSRGSLPTTIIYALNSQMTEQLVNISGAFNQVHVGVPWWFNDHKRGMMDYFDIMSEQSTINSVIGMVTDSRGFLSYSRHDYYRRILSEYLSQHMNGENDETVIKVARNLSWHNAKDIIEE